MRRLRAWAQGPYAYRVFYALAAALFAVALCLGVGGSLESRRAGAASRDVLERMQEGESSVYLGTLVVPSLDLELPVARNISDDLLRVSPCCYAGSWKDDDLIVCGEGYASHFGRIGSLGIRDEVRLLCTDGTSITYIVSNVETDRLEEIDAIMDDWDLTLFTFNADDTCQVVRCVRA